MRDVAWASVGRPAARPRRRLPHPRRLLTPTLPPTRPTRRQPRRYYATLRITNIALGKTESILLRPNSEETTTAVSLARGDNPNSFSLSFPPSPLSLPGCFSLLPLLSCSSFDSLFGWLSFDLSLFFTHTPPPFVYTLLSLLLSFIRVFSQFLWLSLISWIRVSSFRAPQSCLPIYTSYFSTYFSATLRVLLFSILFKGLFNVSLALPRSPWLDNPSHLPFLTLTACFVPFLSSTLCIPFSFTFVLFSSFSFIPMRPSSLSLASHTLSSSSPGYTHAHASTWWKEKWRSFPLSWSGAGQNSWDVSVCYDGIFSPLEHRRAAV